MHDTKTSEPMTNTSRVHTARYFAVMALALPSLALSSTVPAAADTPTKDVTTTHVATTQGRQAASVATALSSVPVASRYEAAEKTAGTLDQSAVNKRQIHLKFVQTHPVRLRGEQLTAAPKALWALEPVFAALDSAGPVKVTPLHAHSEETLEDIALTAQQSSGAGQADLNQWYLLDLGEGVDAAALLESLRRAPIVETAFHPPLPATPPVGDLTPKQVYVGGSASQGIEAGYAHTIPGGTGKNVTVADVEFGWTTNHEDLSKLRGAVITQGTPRETYSNHGTAVMGQIVGDNNGRGITGIAYDAKAVLSHATTTRGYDPASAIVTAANRLSAGDVLVLEQQITGCGGGFAPVEVMPSAYDAIKAAVGKGIHVVEAAGNGSQNLDDPCYGGANFPGGRGDSGAIIVGAGASSTCSRTPGAALKFSTYGSRVNLQGWGECVYTTGYGDLQGGAEQQHYTARFSGTSSATPIVAGAVAVLSSIAKERGSTITPQQMRDLLMKTGKPQTGSRHVGPLPDLRKAIAALPQGGNPGNGGHPDTGKPFPGGPSLPGCSGYAKQATGQLTAGQMSIEPGEKWYQTTKRGVHAACLTGPQNTDFDLHLQQWDGKDWQFVASSKENGSDEKLTYTGDAGFYRIIAFSPAQGQGHFTLGYTTP